MRLWLGLGVIAAAISWGQASPDAVARHAEAAQRAQRSGDFATAVREYGTLARLLPEVAEVHSNLGVAYFFNKQPAEAIGAFEKALQIKPDLVAALVFGGIAHHNLSRYKKATELLEAAVKLSPSDPLARTSLGFSYSAEARFREAAEQFEVAARLEPQNADAWYGLGQAYLELGKEQTKRLAELAPDGPAIRRLAADLWRLRGDESKAQSLYKEAGGRQAGADEQALFREATRYRQMAQSAFERLAAMAPDSYRARQVIAESLAAQRRTSEAITEYREVLNLKPDLAGIHEAIGDLLMSEGKAAEALHEFRRATPNRPNSADLHYRIGKALAVLGDDQSAEAELKKALALSAPPPGVLKELAKLSIRRREHAKATQLLAKYMKVAPDDASAHYLMMRAYSSLGDREASQRHRLKFQELSDREKSRASLNEAFSDSASGQEPELRKP